MIDSVLHDMELGGSGSFSATEVRIRRSDVGRLVVTKSAKGHAAARRLAIEAKTLATARHPGVVELIDAETSGERAGMTVAWAGARTLADIGSLEPEEIAGVTAALATTVAYLHNIGITHGRISPEHIIINRDGAPVLCGFAEAGNVTRADDVAAIGSLMIRFLEQARTHTRPRLGFRRSGTPQRLNRLERIAAIATDSDPARRPTAQALADATCQAIEASRLIGSRTADEPTSTDSTDDPITDPGHTLLDLRSARTGGGDEVTEEGTDIGLLDVFDELDTIIQTGRCRKRKRRRLAAALTAGAVVVVWASWKIASPAFIAPRPSTAASDQIVLPPAEPPATTVPEAPIVEHGGTRFRLGKPGDLALVADWKCTGNPVPAVIRPATREVFVFDGWASVTTPVAAAATLTLPDDVDVPTATPDPNHCGTMLISRHDGPGISVAITNPEPAIDSESATNPESATDPESTTTEEPEQ